MYRTHKIKIPKIFIQFLVSLSAFIIPVLYIFLKIGNCDNGPYGENKLINYYMLIAQ